MAKDFRPHQDKVTRICDYTLLKLTEHFSDSYQKNSKTNKFRASIIRPFINLNTNLKTPGNLREFERVFCLQIYSS